MRKIPINSVYATGRRKTSVVKLWLAPGNGKVTVNNKTLPEHFKRPILQQIIEQPLQVVDGMNKFDIYAVCQGGGLSGQAGAMRLGIARALVKFGPEYRAQLRREGFLTRDPRQKERKKYGQPGARKKYQFSKR